MILFAGTDCKFALSGIGVEAKVFKAVAIVESGGRKSFVSVNGKEKAKILYERHYMYRFLKKIKTEEELSALKQRYPDLVHNIGAYKEQMRNMAQK